MKWTPLSIRPITSLRKHKRQSPLSRQKKPEAYPGIIPRPFAAPGATLYINHITMEEEAIVF